MGFFAIRPLETDYLLSLKTKLNFNVIGNPKVLYKLTKYVIYSP